MSIPKKIHYCWFGRKPLPESAKKCIASWRKYLPDYEIVEWNEDNFDVNAIPYTAQAYSVGKYAFVSDYARFRILYEHGGLYFDTDVEVIRPMDDIIAAGPFMGFEIDPGSESGNMAVNPGLGMGAPRGMDAYEPILEYYSRLRFIKDDNTLNITDAVVNITTREMKKAGLRCVGGTQHVAGISVYPATYFNPPPAGCASPLRRSLSTGSPKHGATGSRVSAPGARVCSTALSEQRRQDVSKT